MLQKTSCRRIVTQSGLSALTSVVQSQMTQVRQSVELIKLPELQDVFPSLSGREAPFAAMYPTSTAVAEEDDIVLYLHSSGSTGFPKPIPQTHKTILQWASCG